MNTTLEKIFSRVKWSFLYRLRKRALYQYVYLKGFRKFSDKSLKLHLGCGWWDYMDGWVNIDRDRMVKADLYMDIQDACCLCKENSVNEIKMVHVITYLRYWEAVDFLIDCYRVLRRGGKLLVESPDMMKLSKKLMQIHSLESNDDRFMYFECLRAIYAFNMDQIKKKDSFTTNAFGWSAMHLKYELEKIGFRDVKILEPQCHDKLPWRDFRIEASK